MQGAKRGGDKQEETERQEQENEAIPEVTMFATASAKLQLPTAYSVISADQWHSHELFLWQLVVQILVVACSSAVYLPYQHRRCTVDLFIADYRIGRLKYPPA